MAKKQKEDLKSKQKRMAQILKILKQEYPESQCSLHFKTPFQLLVATILSAQCTDARVNLVTPLLFNKFPNPQSMKEASLSEIEELIRTTGFFRNKAKSILITSKILCEKYQGVLPQTHEQLIELQGVGRKTANVVLGVAYQIPGLVVDTHVGRLSQRMGFTEYPSPEKIEQEMMQIVPKEDWIHYSHLLIDHGRKICTSRRAKCEDCVIKSYCPKIGV